MIFMTLSLVGKFVTFTLVVGDGKFVTFMLFGSVGKFVTLTGNQAGKFVTFTSLVMFATEAYSTL
jgi:hypothetical protein